MRCQICGGDRDLGECICVPVPPGPSESGPITPYTPPGWYADPAGSGYVRWWSGFAWSGDVRPTTISAESPWASPAGADDRLGIPKRPANWMALVTVVVLFVALVTTGYLRAGSGRAKKVVWAPGVAPIAAFVERQRGLTFHRAVSVEFLPDAQFEAKVGGDSGPPTADQKSALDDKLSEMRALGLMHGTIDLGAASRQITRDEAIGLYVPHDKAIYVRGTEITPAVRVTLAHELTHALQDQHANLQHLGSLAGADPIAVRALVEGDAVHVEDAYAATLSDADHDAYVATERAGASKATAADESLPAFMTNQFAFPYVFGPVFVQALAASGGNAGIDRALVDPPIVDDQIINPGHYVAGDVPAHLDPPGLPAGAEIIDRSPFGLVSSLQVIGDITGYQAAWDGLQGWEGDTGVAYRTAGHVCMVVDTKLSTAGQAEAAATVAAGWAATLPGATAKASGQVLELRSCDPGSAHPAAVAAAPQPFDVLAVRAGIIGELITAQVPVATATCATDRLIVAVGAAQIAALKDRSAQPGDAKSAEAAQDTTIRLALRSALSACGFTGALAPPRS